VTAQAAAGAVRYDIGCDPESGRGYADASCRAPPSPIPSLGAPRRRPVAAVDVTDGRPAVTSVCPGGNILGTARALRTDAHAVGAGAVVIENLDVVDARTQGRRFRRQIAGVPAGAFRDRLTQTASNAGLAVIVVDPAYTST